MCQGELGMIFPDGREQVVGFIQHWFFAGKTRLEHWFGEFEGEKTLDDDNVRILQRFTVNSEPIVFIGDGPFDVDFIRPVVKRSEDAIAYTGGFRVVKGQYGDVQSGFHD
jgi:hypothetical protein